MTSLFEPFGTESYCPPVVQDFVEQELRGVAPLEFLAVDAKPDMKPAATPGEDAAFSVSERARQVIAMVNAARDETATAVRNECTRDFEEALVAEQARVEMLWKEYQRDRREYFQEVERRVVQLSLAIARKVLAREAEIDAMHLTAVVRAALDRVQDESVSRLRVPVSTAADWRALFSRGDVRVEVVSDERLPEGTVRLETNVGQVELGVHAQLEEVELGFQSLMGAG